jgi:hypothetical protein
MISSRKKSFQTMLSRPRCAPETYPTAPPADFDRLVAVGVLREFLGGPVFRLYGL